VIYLSLLALAEKPDLWREYHDENLLFTKTDFADPDSSTLFKKIRELGPEHARLTEALASAAVGPPEDVPSLLDLVKTKSTLPSWMTAPADIEATTKTREVKHADLPPDGRSIRWIPWQDKGRSSTIPATPASATVQTLFGGSPPPEIKLKDPYAVMDNTVLFAKQYIRTYFLAWYWAAYLFLKFFGFSFFFAMFAALVFLTLGCLTVGLIRAIEESRKATRAPLAPGWQHTSVAAAPPIPHPHLSPGWTAPQPGLPPASAANAASDPFVGNLVLGIFHLENCHWVNTISLKNRVGFSTAAEAKAHGFKPCRICSPAA
jgi:hypothetical protein